MARVVLPEHDLETVNERISHWENIRDESLKTNGPESQEYKSSLSLLNYWTKYKKKHYEKEKKVRNGSNRNMSQKKV